MTPTGEQSTFQVTARFFGPYKQVTKKRDIDISLTEKSTVSLLLEVIITQYPPLKDLILDEYSKLGSWVVILINGRNMSIFNGLNTPLKEGDTIAIFPPVAGG
ncbi:molybdopterin synthase sulfur carrier subunit [Candidatus Heimdallarchaeota archaeon B3_Heim]|nr:MAG: molybdopterin synthase sulfur carrier subunit [Candidatus Heimdallarchaeota archaeon B3_Heim]